MHNKWKIDMYRVFDIELVYVAILLHFYI